MKDLQNVDMSSYTSFKTGGEASRLVIVESEEELQDLLRGLGDEPYILLGNGSNTLFAGDIYPGTVIKLGAPFDYVTIEENRAKTGAGTLLSKLAKEVGRQGYTGLEFAAGIPGSVGGGIFMNAGAYDGEIKDTLSRVKVVAKDGNIRWIDASDLDLSYRHSKLMETGEIILEAEFDLTKGDPEQIRETMKDLAERRSSKQPLEFPSAGSFFKRPEGHFAGKLIEDAGLAGYTIGGAQVSDKHCGFIINRDGATKEDIIELMNHVQSEVWDKFHVRLEPEVRIIDECSDPDGAVGSR